MSERLTDDGLGNLNGRDQTMLLECRRRVREVGVCR
jgi:hypothetical protein